MSDHYWTDFWIAHGDSSVDQDPQSRVFRTLNQQPISEADWLETLRFILRHLSLESHHRLLDLGGGNGLIARELVTSCKEVTVIDISNGLLEEIGEAAGTINAIQGDMREIEFDDASFDRILLYAALQYLTQAEAAALFKRIFSWLTPGGVLFIGDIPDAALQWKFFDTPQRRSSYFTKLQAGQSIVGTWYEREWLSYLAAHCGFREAEVLEQPSDQIYSWFRFDMVWKK